MSKIIKRVTISSSRWGPPILDIKIDWKGDQDSLGIAKTAQIFFQFAKTLGETELGNIIFEDPDKVSVDLGRDTKYRKRRSFQTRKSIGTSNTLRNKGDSDSDTCSMTVIKSEHFNCTIFNKNVRQSFDDTNKKRYSYSQMHRKTKKLALAMLKLLERDLGEYAEKIDDVLRDIADEKKKINDLRDEDKEVCEKMRQPLLELVDNFEKRMAGDGDSEDDGGIESSSTMSINEKIYGGGDEYLIGTIIGWISASFYLGSRIPQLIKNYRRKSTDGLSLQMFISAVLGNSTYAIGILLRSTEWSYVETKIPWLVGSIGTLCFDFTMFFQFYYYRRKREKEKIPSIDSIEK